MRPMFGWIAALAIFVSATAQAQASEPAPVGIPSEGLEVWLNPGMYSRHFERDLGLREKNYGFGVEIVSRREHGVMLGQYRNSNDRSTRYLTYVWRPLLWGDDDGLRAGLGVIVGVFDGYPAMRQGGWFPALLPVASVEYKRVGINLTIVPNYGDKLHGAVALQVKFRVW